MDQNQSEHRDNFLKKFFQKQKVRLSSLQEARFERSERELIEILGDDGDDSGRFPAPGILVGILTWVFIIFFPLMMILDPAEHMGTPVNIRNITGFYVPLFATLLVFIANQRLLVPRFFFRKKYWKYLGANTLLLSIAFVSKELVGFLVVREPGQGIAYFVSDFAFAQGRNHFIWMLVTFFIFVVMICLICIMISVFSRQIIKSFILREKRRSALQNELDFLKQQLSPHFLFNTLNNISSLISFDPKLAESSMTKLSGLLRMMLYQTGDNFVLLKEDVDILEKYADLEKLRLDESFDFSFKVNLENPNRQIEPLIMMPLMENSMKHCVNPNGKSFAHIEINQTGDELCFRAENSNFPRKSQRSSSGLGLATFKKRLDLMYEGRYTYETKVENETYICELKLTLK